MEEIIFCGVFTLFQVNHMLTFLRGAIIKYITDFYSSFAKYVCRFIRCIKIFITRFQFFCCGDVYYIF